MRRMKRDSLLSVYDRLTKLVEKLPGGLQKPKAEIERLLQSADISADARAEDLTIAQWLTLLQECDIMKR